MKKEIKEQWVKALRSGDYVQGTGHLRLDNSFCCLGVLCDLAEKQKICKVKRDIDGLYLFDDSSGGLPATVLEWAGLSRYGPEVEYQGFYEELAWLNDYENLTFDQLADLIEKQL